MKHNMIWLAILVLAFAAGVAGLRLADPDDTGYAQDRLTGLLLTTEPIYQLDFSDARIRPETDTISFDASKQKMYAVEEIEGENRSYSFPDITDPHVIFVRDQNPAGFASVYLDESPGIYTYLHYTDRGETGDVKLTAEARVRTEQDTVLYPSLIYRERNGAVYTRGTGSGYALNSESPGHQYSLTYEDTYTQTENRNEETDTIRIDLDVYTQAAAEAFRIVEMDDHDRILHEQTFPAADLPEQIEPQAETAYIVVETQKAGGEGRENPERALYNRTDKHFDVYTCETTFCERHTLTLIWQE